MPGLRGLNAPSGACEVEARCLTPISGLGWHDLVMRLVERTLENIHSPIGEAFALVDQRVDDRPLLDLSQAAPSNPTAPAVVDRIVEVAKRLDGGRYCPQAGLAHLREAFADELTSAYGAKVDVENVMITAGCNQAFCLTASALAAPGDEIILQTPFYFNHDMWLRLDGVTPVHLAPDEHGYPDVDRCRALISDTTRAIVVVSPGNPTGVTIPAERIEQLAILAREHDLMLIVDETYRSFRETTDPPHRLFAQPAWTDSVVSLHSFSKEFAIPGYRVGAAVGHPALLAEALKLLDCVAICAPRIGQEAAHAGLTQAVDWRKTQVDGIAERHGLFVEMMKSKPGGLELVSSGAYFGWVRHPFESTPTMDIVRQMLVDLSVLTIPGHAFTGNDDGFIRMSFANLDVGDFGELGARLASLSPTA